MRLVLIALLISSLIVVPMIILLLGRAREEDVLAQLKRGAKTEFQISRRLHLQEVHTVLLDLERQGLVSRVWDEGCDRWYLTGYGRDVVGRRAA